MMLPRPSMPYEFRLRPASRTLVLLVTALALAVVISLIWISAAHPQAGGLMEAPQFGGPAAIRWMTAWLVMGACGLVAVIGLLLLAMDLRTGRLAGHRPGKHLGRP